MLKNTNKQYGSVSVSFHWLSAILVVGMFILGWWMLTLTYYDEWYRLGPWWHKSIGTKDECFSIASKFAIASSESITISFAPRLVPIRAQAQNW